VSTPHAGRPEGRAPTAATEGHHLRRILALVGLVALPVVLGGCELPNFFGYRGATTQAHDEHLLWSGTFIAAIVVGGVVGLMLLWAILRYRRRSDEIPRQTQYHTVFEITYTIVPVVIVLVLFAFTVIAENKIDALSPPTVQTVNVYAFQWGWEFQYAGKGVTVEGERFDDPDPVGLNGGQCAPAVDCLGPGLVLPAGQTVLVNLRSKDTIHGFYVPQFNFSRYAQPGILNQFQFTVKNAGVYRAQCTQFCGLYHSQMFFHVVALPPTQFQRWLLDSRLPVDDSQNSSNSSHSSNSSYSSNNSSSTEAAR